MKNLTLKNIISTLEAPKGRMQKIKYNDNMIVIDYAHTPDALENFLETVKQLKYDNIYTVIGCGGDRDKFKRKIMGEISTNLSDYVIFTSDNPRSEKIIDIINDMIEGIQKNNYEIIENRESAIIRGIQLMGKSDILLILGKGHEEYQIIGNKKYDFSDQEIVQKNI